MLDPKLISSLRLELESSIATANALEMDVKVRQERLRAATDKVERIKAVLAVFESEAAADHAQMHGSPETDAEPPSPSPIPPQQNVSTDWRASTKRARIGGQVDELLTLHGTMHRKAILDHLVVNGIMGTEQKPLAYLAAFLSDNRDKYEPDGNGNFRLRRNGHHEPPPASNGAGHAEAGGVAPPAVSLA
jgi:hypothetical protein